jgi:hypothetical protein
VFRGYYVTLQDTVVVLLGVILSRNFKLDVTSIWPAIWGILREAKLIPQSGALRNFKTPACHFLELNVNVTTSEHEVS